MSTNYANAERLRKHYLTAEPRKVTRNICIGRRNWDVCDYGDVYAGTGLECWKQDGKHACCKLVERSIDHA